MENPQIRKYKKRIYVQEGDDLAESNCKLSLLESTRHLLLWVSGGSLVLSYAEDRQTCFDHMRWGCLVCWGWLFGVDLSLEIKLHILRNLIPSLKWY